MKKVLLYIVLITLMVLSMTDLFYTRIGGNTVTGGPSMYIRAALLIVMISYLVFTNIGKSMTYLRSPIFRSFFILSLYLLIHNFCTTQSFSAMGPIMRVIYAPVGFFFIYSLSYENIFKDSQYRWFIFILSILVLITIFLFTAIRIDVYAAGLGKADNTGYLMLFCLPTAILMHRNKILFPILISIIILGVLIAAKRGAMISLVLALLFMFHHIFTSKKTPNTYKWLYVAVIVIFAFVALRNFGEYTDAAFNRLENIEKDGGSGRDDIFPVYWNGFLDADFENMLLGHGYLSGFTNLNIKVLPHNDWLQLLYDFGIVGALLYFVIFGQVFALILRLRRKRNIYWYMLVMTLIILSIKSFVSGTIFMSADILILYMAFAYVTGKIDNGEYYKQIE